MLLIHATNTDFSHKLIYTLPHSDSCKKTIQSNSIRADKPTFQQFEKIEA